MRNSRVSAPLLEACAWRCCQTFPAQARVVPAVVAAVDLAGAADARLARLGAGRLAGLRLQESGHQLGLVSATECAATDERHLCQPVPEPLSQAALDTLAIVAYEQPVTPADIRAIRSVDSDAVVETIRARGLVTEDPRSGGRGRPGLS